MEIIFSCEPWDNEGHGLCFKALVNNSEIICDISQEALQDIDPKNRFDSKINQFNNNISRIHEIAEQKIKNDEDKISISSNDICKPQNI